MEQSAAATLAGELEKAPLPLIEVIRRALAIAGAVNQLHRAGRVHGRLEPAVIGLAQSGVQLAESQAEAASITSYTAPEQLDGEGDSRSDIFAFGAILYEMASGWKAFPGDTAEALRTAILESQPKPLANVLPHATSPAYTALDKLIAGCLVKNPGQRRQRMQNVLVDLKLMAVLVARATPRSAPVAPANPQPMPPLAISLRPPDPTAEIPLQTDLAKRWLAPSVNPESAAPEIVNRDAKEPGSAERRTAMILNSVGYGKEPGSRSKPAATTSAVQPKLQAIAPEEPNATSIYTPVSRRRNGVWKLAITVTIVALLALGVLAAGVYRHIPAFGLRLPSFGKSAPLPLGKLSFPLPPPDRASYMSSPAISPDGRLLAFSAVSPDKKRQLWIRPLSSVDATPLAGTGDALAPFWSPDSKQIGFFAGKKLMKIALAGGSPVTLCETEGLAGGASWSRAGVILFGRSFNDSLYRISDQGGAPQPVTRLDPARGERAHLWPRFLPDASHFLLYAIAEQEDNSGVSIGSLDSKETRHLLSSETNAIYAEPALSSAVRGGFLLFARGRRLMAQPFDARALALKGDPFTVAQGITYLGFINLLPISASDNGLLAYQNIDAPKRQLVWFDRDGNQVGAIGEPAEYGQPRISPNGKVVAVNRLASEKDAADIWAFDLESNTASQVTTEPTHEGAPVWSPDGREVVYFSNPNGHFDLYRKPVAGGRAELLLATAEDKYPNDWSPDGRYLLFGSMGAGTSSDLWLLPMKGEHKPVTYLQTVSTEGYGQFSPDGKWVAYQSDESGRAEVYVEAFPRPQSQPARYQVSHEGGGLPKWRGDGKELYYITGSGKMMAVNVSTAAGFAVSGQRALFQSRALPRTWNLFDVTRDGSRFLVNTPLEWASSSPITVIANWTEGFEAP